MYVVRSMDLLCLGHDSRLPEPARRIYRRRSQSELFAPVSVDESTTAVAAITTIMAAESDVKTTPAVGGQIILTNGDVAAGGRNLKPQGVGGGGPVPANSDTDPDKKDSKGRISHVEHIRISQRVGSEYE